MPHLCIVAAFLRLLKHANELGQSSDSPLAVYTGKEGALRYLTSAELSKHIKSAATVTQMHVTPEELALFSCHSLQVWVAVLLSDSGKN